MKVRVIGEAGYEQALFGLGLSFGKTSGKEFSPEESAKMTAVAERLAGKGGGHDKFLRQISVWVDVEAPLYWWKQMDCYAVGVAKQSESTMHTLMNKPFSPDMFEVDSLRGYKRQVKQEIPSIDGLEEVWVTYPKAPNYLVSNLGRIKRCERFCSGNGNTYKEKILKPTVTFDGYLQVGMLIGEKTKTVRVHRVIAECFLEKVEGKDEVNHKDGNKLNAMASNLEYCSSSENQKHAVQNNLSPSGLTTYLGKFTQEERENIIQRYNNGESARGIAKSLNVSHTCILDIAKGKYRYEKKQNEYKMFCENFIPLFNERRLEWLETKDPEVWSSINGLLPQSFKQRRIVSMNYAVLDNIIRQRRGHKLSEWAVFIAAIERQIEHPELLKSLEK